MALEKQIFTPDNTGCSANYWKIAEINADWINNIIKVILHGYLSQQASEENRQPMLQREYVATGEAATLYFSMLSMQQQGVDIMQLAYQFVKGFPRSEFNDATDV